MGDKPSETLASTVATEAQRIAFERHYDRAASENPEYDWSDSSVDRFLIERRLQIAIGRLLKLTASRPADWTALVVCAGPGIEGTFLADAGFMEVTISDFSQSGLTMGASRDGRLKSLLLNAEDMHLPNDSYDLVIVQDGLHHLPRPPIGLTEMIRVARRGVIVIEPHSGLVGRALGTEWERTDLAVNYVFRWNRWLFCSIVRSYLLLGRNTAEVVRKAPMDPAKPYRLNCKSKDRCSYRTDVIRLWDHHGTMKRLAQLFGNGRLALLAVRAAYALCSCLPRLGNMFIGILVKDVS